MENLPTTQQIGERAFREIAGLCIRCGEARSETDSGLCGLCQQTETLKFNEVIWQMLSERVQWN